MSYTYPPPKLFVPSMVQKGPLKLLSMACLFRAIALQRILNLATPPGLPRYKNWHLALLFETPTKIRTWPLHELDGCLPH